MDHTKLSPLWREWNKPARVRIAGEWHLVERGGETYQLLKVSGQGDFFAPNKWLEGKKEPIEWLCPTRSRAIVAQGEAFSEGKSVGTVRESRQFEMGGEIHSSFQRKENTIVRRKFCRAGLCLREGQWKSQDHWHETQED